MDVARAWASETTSPNTSEACLAITDTSARSLLPVRPSMTAPMTGWSQSPSDFSVADCEDTMAWKTFSPMLTMFLQEKGSSPFRSIPSTLSVCLEDLQSDVDDVPPGERILSIQINPVHPVSLAG